jgi:N,N'-diacetylchitobiose phosphorylase
LLGLAADWNDCLNLRGKGESMFSTFLFLHALNEFITLAARLKKRADVKKYGAIRAAIQKAIDKCAWDGDWFLRGYLDSGRKLGGKKSEQSKIFINSQTWAVIAGAAERGKLERAMDSLKEHLSTEHGIVINAPAFREHDPEVGAVTSFPPGLKENAGIFCHANTWTVVAEGLLGRGDRAFELYRSFLPAAKNDNADLYTMEPYVYSQFITGKEHPYHFGRARNSWLTGTASWAFVALTQYILGVRVDYDGLVLSPAIPSSWDGFEVKRQYRGATYEIKVENPNGVSSGIKRLTVDGKAVEGNRIPIAKKGRTVEVVATLET